MMRRRTFLIAAGVLLALLAVVVLKPLGTTITPPASAPSAGRCPDQTAAPGSITIGQWQDSVSCLLNRERITRGLRPLTFNTHLARAGASHASSMNRRNYFSHTEPNGSTVHSRAFQFGYAPGVGKWQVGEDLAWVWGSDATPRDTVRAWMNSLTHRRQILTPSYRNVAVSAVHGAPQPNTSAPDSLTVAAEFGHR